MSEMEALQSKLQNVVINESNSNHIKENNSHSGKKSSKIENCEKNIIKNDEGENEEVRENHQITNGKLSSCNKDSSSDNEISTPVGKMSQHPTIDELSQQLSVNEISPFSSCSVEESETVEMTRELPDKSTEVVKITYKVYESELELPSIMKLIQKDLSEPYSIYTYRYFIHNWPKLCYLALSDDKCIGCIVCKLDVHRQMINRGYIAMLAVDKDYRKLKIGTNLVQKAIRVRVSHIDCYFFNNTNKIFITL
jgi:peptide alpha-N-acetyltransferase